MTKEERDAVYSWCASIDNIIISMEREINMLRTHLDILTKVCEGDPQTEPKWIPVEERLPEENVPVNITWVNRKPESYYADIKDKPFTATGVHFDGHWYWWSSTVEDLLAEYGRATWDTIFELMDESIEVIAWCPLPEPYKGVTE